jgi:tRNA nucleotidyltransferase/poly(A) polymerase
MQTKTATLHENALHTLKSWKGFSSISDALERFPDVDIFLAGGVIRNLLADIEIPSKDFDFFVDGPNLDEFLHYLAVRGKLTFGPFGSPRWHHQVDDDSYCDIVLIRRFYNGLWHCRDIIDVLNQFDFTANAVALNLRSGAICNPQNGVDDATKRIIRAVRFDYPEEAISNTTSLSRNCVLWIRLQHYATVLGFDIEPVTQKWIAHHNSYAQYIPLFESIFYTPKLNAF